MKKFLLILIFSFFFNNTSFAETYYFKECKLSGIVKGDYIINLKKNLIEVELKSADGNVQNFSDKIKLIQKNKIVSEKIKSVKGENIYYQYFLNSDSKSVTKMEYIKQSGIDIDVYKPKEKRKSYCLNVKSDWNKKKIDDKKLSEEQKQILEAQKKLKKEKTNLITCQGNDHKKWTKCTGIYKSETGHKYDGIFINGKILKGTSIYPGGAKYVGDFKNFKPHGFGTFFWKNGDKYFGQWLNGKSNGSGTKTWKDGRKYSGIFKNDELHGEGTLIYPDGNKYVGEFLNGKRHGKGVFLYSDGSSYIGEFIAGKEHGMGECVSVDGSSVPCKDRKVTQSQDFSGKNIRKISITAEKWVRISQYESNTKKGKKITDKLKSDFEEKALGICGSAGSYKIVQKRIEILDLDETPAYGLETKVLLVINGIVECI